MIVELIKSLLTLSINNRLKHNNELFLHPLQYAYEFKTIGMTLPRQCGKTKSIIEFVNNISSRCLVVVRDYGNKHEYQRCGCEVISLAEYDRIVYTLARHQDYQYVIFDDCGDKSKISIDDIYYATNDIKNCMQTFIKIST